MFSQCQSFTRPMGPWLLLILTAAAPWFGSGCSQPLSAQPDGETDERSDPASVLVATVHPTRDHLQKTTTQPAHVEPYAQADIYAKASGYLQEIHVDIGDRVEKGQILAELFIPELETELVQKQAQVTRAEAEQAQTESALEVTGASVEAAEARLEEVRASVDRYEAQVALWSSELRRTETLVNRAAATQSLLDETRSKFRAAEADREMVRAQVQSAEAALSKSRAERAKAQADIVAAVAHVDVARAELKHFETLKRYAQVEAPFDGLITRRLVDPGAFIRTAAESGSPRPLLTIVRLDRKRIVVDVPDSEAGWVQIGQPATLRYNGQKTRSMPGEVVRIADALAPGTRTMRVEIQVEEPEQIRTGTYGQVEIILADYPDAMLLPSTALIHDGNETVVMVVEDGKARRRIVEVGLDDGTQAQILSGLDDEAEVIIEGKTSVRDSQPVEVAG